MEYIRKHQQRRPRDVLTLNHGNDNPRIRYSLYLKEVKGGTVIRDLEAGLGYEMSAEILYMPQWMQKLKDAGRIEFYFFGRLSNPGVQVGYEDAYLYDFYVDRIGKHGIEFYWVCKSATDPDNDTFRFTHLLKDYELTNRGPLYSTRIYFDVLMTEKVGGTRYIYSVKLQQAGGEFTEATSATHKISMHPDTLAKCYHNPSWQGIPSKWKYSSIDDAYTMEFYIYPRHGYEFSGSSVLSSQGIKLNVQNTKVTEKRLVKFRTDPRLCRIPSNQPCGKAKADRCARHALRISVSALTPGLRSSYRMSRKSIPSKIRWYTILAMATPTA